jgi:hypothetical protein
MLEPKIDRLLWYLIRSNRLALLFHEALTLLTNQVPLYYFLACFIEM